VCAPCAASWRAAETAELLLIHPNLAPCMQHRQSFKLQLRACMYALGSVAQNVCHNSVGSALTVISPIHALAVPHVCLSVCSAVGLVSSLVQHGVLTRPAQLAGSSAGSLIAASFNAGGGGGGLAAFHYSRGWGKGHLVWVGVGGGV
jgi:hypothetical protein